VPWVYSGLGSFCHKGVHHMTTAHRLNLAKTASFATLAAMTFALSSCTPPSTMMASIVGGKPAFVVCSDVVSNGITVSTFDATSPDSNDLVDVWQLFSLETQIGEGTVFVVGAPTEGFREDLAFDQKFLDDSLSFVSIAIRETRGSVDVAQFELLGLTEGSWTDSQGRIHLEPC
jgi:hypothetical protein